MEKTVYEGKFIKVTEEEIGEKIFERAYIVDPVIIFPFNEKGQLLLVKERRPHEKPAVRWKLVTGVYEKEFSLEENVNRELQEEIGKKALKVKHYMTVKQTGTINESRIYAIATKLIDSKIPNPDGEDTILKVKPLILEDVVDKVLKGKILKNATGYMLLKLYHDINNKKVSIKY